jgi:cholesterol oxidase
LLDFLKQLTTLRTAGPTFADRVEAIDKFGKYFLGSLWSVRSVVYA